MSASTKSSSRGTLPDISTTSFYEPRERGTAPPASHPPRPAGRRGPGVRPGVVSPRVESLGLLRSSPALSEGSSSHCQTPLRPGWGAWHHCQTPTPPRLGSMAPRPDPCSTQAGEHGPTARPLLHPGWGAWPHCQTPAPPRLGSMAWGSACSAMGDLLQPNCSPVQASPTYGV